MSSEFFIDWITISQRHPDFDGLLPLFHDGFFINLDLDGNPIYQIQKSARVEGSFDTRIMLRCDGETVYLSGNVGAFGRPDNVFGYSLHDLISKCNVLLSGIGLPPFSFSEYGEFVDYYNFRTRRNVVRFVYSGAIVTRLDLTKNYSLGSLEDALAYLAYMSSKKSFRTKQTSYGASETVETVAFGVDGNTASKYVTSKLYLKSQEMKKHKKKILFRKKNGKEIIREGKDSDYLHKLINYVESNGFVRFEVSLKSRYLYESNLRYLGALNNKRLTAIFDSKASSIFTDFSISNVSTLPRPTLRAFNDWKSGVDLRTLFNKSAFYNHRKLILACGVDIAYPYSDTIMDFLSTKNVSIKEAVMPDFYFLPEISNHIPQQSEGF
ncbi:MAG: phage/plasmid replication protein [Bacteroidales bacterium]|nr:phage/plasmid replication protein [Bacteroidales bacterium]